MSDMPTGLTPAPAGFSDWMADLKSRIHSVQQRAKLAVNRELVLPYWQIGRDILTRQAEQGWNANLQKQEQGGGRIQAARIAARRAADQLAQH